MISLDVSFFIYSSIIERYIDAMKLNNEQFNILRKISRDLTFLSVKWLKI